jgi:transketolase
MRNAFADEITALSSVDPRIVMLSADIGNRLFDKFKAKQPDRFYNCGVAEANMISLAAGLASTGLRPVCYTITPFITARCFEQIRVDVCYHHQPVVIVGTGSGLSYASLGATHHSLEDIALLRTLPTMRVLAPADSMELRACLRAALQGQDPVYIRIGKKGEPVIFPKIPAFEFGVWNELRPGTNVALLAAGNMLPTILQAADMLEQSGIHPRVYSCASIKPLDESTLHRVFTECDVVVTAEEHSKIGGFGSAVAEWLVDQPIRYDARLLRFGAADHFLHEAGEQDHARQTYGLTAPAIAESVQASLIGVR